MQLPIVAPAPLVTAHADFFRDLFENRCQFRHFQNYLTGLIVLDNKSLANITRCVLESADKTNLSRFFSEAPWFQDRVNDRRLVYLLQQTKAVRSLKADALLILDDTLCEHVGSLFDYVDRHYNHGDGTYPLAHNPVTSHYVSGPVRFPVDLRLSRRYEELTEWETFVQKHFPGRPIPTTKQDRARLHKEVDPILVQDAALEKLHKQLRTKIELGIALLEAAMQHKVPFSVIVFDSWYLAEEKPESGDQQLFPHRCRGTTHPAGGATHCGGRPGTTPPAHGVSGRHGRGQHLLDLSPGCTSPRAGQSPAGGPLQERGVDGHLCRVGEHSGGLECAPAPHPVSATLAD